MSKVARAGIMAKDLLGIWYNELGSRMNIVSATKGELTGTYHSKVGDAEGEYVMSGRYDTVGQTLGWIVTWNNEHNGSSFSTTGWSGQYHTDSDDPEIHVTWLLTSQATPNNDWKSTQVGIAVFKREKPSPDVIVRK